MEEDTRVDLRQVKQSTHGIIPHRIPCSDSHHDNKAESEALTKTWCAMQQLINLLTEGYSSGITVCGYLVLSLKSLSVRTLQESIFIMITLLVRCSLY